MTRTGLPGTDVVVHRIRRQQDLRAIVTINVRHA